MFETFKLAYEVGKAEMGKMSEDRSGQGFVGATIGIMIGLVVLVVASTLYDGLNKDFLIGGSRAIADLVILIIAAGLVVGGIVALFSFALRR